MAMKFTMIAEDTFKSLQLNAGVLAKSFSPETATLDAANVLCATSGGISASCVPTFQDMGEGIDNCPANMKELKEITGYTCTMSFTNLSITAEMLKLSLGSADVSGKKIAPTEDLEDSDFTDLWWIGDLSDGGFVAVKLINALSTGGLSIKSNDKNKGNSDVTLTGHYSITNQHTVPMEFYISAAA